MSRETLSYITPGLIKEEVSIWARETGDKDQMVKITSKGKENQDKQKQKTKGFHSSKSEQNT